MRHVVSAYRGGEGLARSTSSEEIIDLDLAPPAPARRWTSKIDLLCYLEEARKRVRSDSDDAVFVTAKLTASATYLRAQLGERLPFREYARRTVGVQPTEISEDEIDLVRSEIANRLA